MQRGLVLERGVWQGAGGKQLGGCDGALASAANTQCGGSISSVYITISPDPSCNSALLLVIGEFVFETTPTFVLLQMQFDTYAM